MARTVRDAALLLGALPALTRAISDGRERRESSSGSRQH
jgi:hypothetical protein